MRYRLTSCCAAEHGDGAEAMTVAARNFHRLGRGLTGRIKTRQRNARP